MEIGIKKPHQMAFHWNEGIKNHIIMASYWNGYAYNIILENTER